MAASVNKEMVVVGIYSMKNQLGVLKKDLKLEIKVIQEIGCRNVCEKYEGIVKYHQHS